MMYFNRDGLAIWSTGTFPGGLAVVLAGLLCSRLSVAVINGLFASLCLGVCEHQPGSSMHTHSAPADMHEHPRLCQLPPGYAQINTSPGDLINTRTRETRSAFTYETRGLRQRARPSYSTHTPNTVTPVSLTSMELVPRSRQSAREYGDATEGKQSDSLHADTLLKGTHTNQSEQPNIEALRDVESRARTE
ncbi:uncharacterized [Tachysurus ichikawai]